MPYIRHGPLKLDDFADRDFCTVSEYAALTRCDPRTVVSAIKAGEIPAVKTGAAYRIPLAPLRQAASGQPVGGAA